MSVNLAEVLKLPVDERLKLVESIWNSIAEFPDSLELTAGQKEELDRRLAEYDADPSDGISWTDLKAQLLAD
ncbi:MAG: addiction module protein [Woeseia sp.]|jgi:putative addiction module component (TIGR02574 family)|nr:addiction module protein [Woeseia sp.]MBT6210031.1 addiction module protein [Woeseia sp.]